MMPLYIQTGKDEKGGSPICPHCNEQIKIIADYRSHLKFLSNMHVFTCSNCRKVLSIAIGSK